MSSLRKDLRSDLEKTVFKARDLAEHAATAALQALAVDQPKPFPHMDADARALRNRLRERGRAAGDVREEFSNAQNLGHLAQLVGYEHWHRMLFARFLAENGLLLEPEYNTPIPLFGRDSVQELAQLDNLDLWQLAGSYAQRMLPEVFRNDDPALQVSLAREDRVKLEKLLADLDSATFTATDSLGWTYQFWQTKRKKEVNDSGVKIGADEISPVTQLFTEDYMVDFLLDNTLGAWHAGKVLAANPTLAETAHSEDELRAAVALPGCPWSYLRFSRSVGILPRSQDAHAPWTPAAGTFDGWPKNAAELKCLDPCCGSGHFLVAMFERLVALVLAETQQDEAAAVKAVIRDNVFGLELDPRCTQIGAFSLALAAWRRVGHCQLPSMNVACSGLAPNTPEKDWLAMAGDNDKLRRGMERLYRLFQNAPVLGSLINPRAGGGDLLEASFHELQPLLEKALAQETEDNAVREMAVTAKGVAKAAEILAGQFTLVATNVPYLISRKQDSMLQEFCAKNFPASKGDLATTFIDRGLAWLADVGTQAIVAPQNWLFLGSYEEFRSDLLRNRSFNLVARLGAKGFQTPMWDFNVALFVVSGKRPNATQSLVGLSVETAGYPEEKASELPKLEMSAVPQLSQLKNPGSALTFAAPSTLSPLSRYTSAPNGSHGGDSARHRRPFWEFARISRDWKPFQGTFSTTTSYAGRESLFSWFDDGSEHRDNPAARLQGEEVVGKRGVVVSMMGALPVALYLGDLFDISCTPIVPRDPNHLAAVWAYCSSQEYFTEVRKIDQALKVTNATLAKVPFDLAHWQKVAAEKYPDGLPKPFSSDSTQWLFNGHPAGSDQPLHVAVARLLGYLWPRQTGSSFPDCPALGPDGLESFADDDGIVCLTPLRGEAKGAERLRKLLDAAWRTGFQPVSEGGHLGCSSSVQAGSPHSETGKDAYSPPSWDERQLLATAGAKSTSLEDWLRDEFFEQHAKLFHHRPFIWHIWDGRPDGFHALVNYHQLAAPDGAGHKLLETLTYAYLGDWIRRQKDDANNNVPGAESRLEAAETLQQELKNILAGEPPYDLFVRWKPLDQQAIGWHPDPNDGVRLNIRPFLYARDVKKKATGILRWKPNVKWTKDRGTEPQRSKPDFPWFWTWDEKTPDFQGSHKFDGNRWNDLHYSNETKQAARAALEKKGTEA